MHSHPAGNTVAGKTALVLSAGGVFGAYQAGVWKAWADSFQPDIVVGASIGAINGWLIAAGCPPADLEALWLNAEDMLAIRPKAPRGWSQGFLDGATMARRLSELCGQYTPKIAFAAVATELRRRKRILFSGPDVGCAHLLASCAVPAAFDLQRIDGTLYADGGLFEALPLWAAQEMGATRIVAVQVMPPTPRAVGWALNAACRRIAAPGLASSVETLLIQPDPPLGSYFDILRYRRDRIRRWIELGYEDGRRARDASLALTPVEGNIPL